jgi:hypothetical protein
MIEAWPQRIHCTQSCKNRIQFDVQYMVQSSAQCSAAHHLSSVSPGPIWLATLPRLIIWVEADQVEPIWHFLERID